MDSLTLFAPDWWAARFLLRKIIAFFQNTQISLGGTLRNWVGGFSNQKKTTKVYHFLGGPLVLQTSLLNIVNVQLRWASPRTSCQGTKQIAKENGTPEAHLEESRGGKEDGDLFCEEGEEYVDADYIL